MNVSLTCEISLSKKMRAIIGDKKASITLNVSSIYSGLGCGTLTISTDENENFVIPEDFLNKETSIMILPKEIEDEIQNVNSPVMSIFSDKDRSSSNVQYGNSKKTSIDKLAVRNPPEKEEVKHAVKTKQEIIQETPEEFEVDANTRSHISTLSELIESINRAKNKVADIDLESITDPRKKAIAIEQKESMEAIDDDAWVVNTTYASMTINDLGIQLPLNTPYNLNHISAKRLAMSRELQNYIKNGTVKLISPEEASEYANIHIEKINSGLEVYDSSDEAESNLFRGSQKIDDDPAPKSSNRMITMDELDEPTEEEKLINSTKVGNGLPSGGITLSGGIRKTSHSVGGGIRRSVPVSQPSNSGGSGFKTISKK